MASENARFGELSSPHPQLSGLFPAPAAIIALTAFLVILPMFFLGNASGHDFEFHLNSWMEVTGQWRQGIVYPRWAALAHYGYGEARFIFYPPASWMLGALLGAVLPWLVVPGAYIWMVLTAAGFSMFYLVRRWLSRPDAIFASALYAANPYHLVIVYWRSAFAELLASILLPLLLLFLVRAEKGKRGVVSLALVVASAWLANAPSAVMVNYSLALMILILSLVRRSPRMLLSGVSAVVLGAGLASFYLLPAACEEKWVDIEQVLSPGVRPQDNFLFTSTNDPDHNRFNRLVSTLAIAEFVVVAAAISLAGRWRPDQPDFWWTLLAWAAAAALLMFSITSAFWEHLPKLRFVQLPWRWLLCFNLSFAFFVTVGMRQWVSRVVVCLLMLTVLSLMWQKVQAPWWDTAADIAEIRDNVREGIGYEGTDEYVPRGADAYQIRQDARKVAVEGGGKIRIHIQQWAPESKYFTADVTQPAKLVLRLFNYPSWKVEVNDRLIRAETEEVTGQMIIPVQPGDNRVRIRLSRTWDRTMGAAISLVAVILTIWFALPSKHLRAATSLPGQLSAHW